MSRVNWKVDDFIRVPAERGGFRVWRVIGVFYGGENQEDLIELQTLDREDSAEGRILVPAEMLNATWETMQQ